MTEPADPSGEYRLSPAGLEDGIRRFLAPVIDSLTGLRDGYLEAHGEVQSAHSRRAAGWFGGEGNSVVPPASSSFFNEVEWQLRQLVGEQTEMVASLEEYRTMLRGHIDWAVRTDDENAERFRAIDRAFYGGR